MATSRLDPGDEIAVYACGLLVEVRRIERRTARKVIDERGGQWTVGGEPWGFADRAADADWMRPADPGDREQLRFNESTLQLQVARIRARLRRMAWFSPSDSRRGIPSNATVLKVWEALMADKAFVQEHGRRP